MVTSLPSESCPSMDSLKITFTFPLLPKPLSILPTCSHFSSSTSLPRKNCRLVSLSKRSLTITEQLSTTRSTAPFFIFFLKSFIGTSFSSKMPWIVPKNAILQAFSSLSMSGLQPMTLKATLVQNSFSKVITANILVPSDSLDYLIIYSSTSLMARQDSLKLIFLSSEQKSLSSPSTVWWPDMMLNLTLFLIGRLYSLTRLRSITIFLHFRRQPGVQAIPRSTRSASRWYMSMATLSPCLAAWMGLRNISIDLILHFCCISHSSISSPGLTLPSTMVPVMTVPFPLILKQWSMRYRNLFSVFLSGSVISSKSMVLSLQQYYSQLFLAENCTILTFSPNLVLAKTFLRAMILVSMILGSWIWSALLRTMRSGFMQSSAMMMHSAVCAWMPLVMSTTRNMRSMICAPPMMVRMSEACPGQSTSVNCRYSSFTCLSNRVGTRVKNAEKPRSSVIPRSCDCGFLSRLAVEVTSLRILQSDVLPESTWPSTPMLMFRHFAGWMVAIYSLLKSRSYFSIGN